MPYNKLLEVVTHVYHYHSYQKQLHHPQLVTAQNQIGLNFAADIIYMYKQKILVTREIFTSFTSACLIESENHSDIRDGLISLCVGLRPLDGPPAVIRVDPAPGFTKLKEDKTLSKHHLCIEVGRIKNVNKNPVAEKAIKELEDELIRQNPDRTQITSSMLAISVATLNSRIRLQGLSAKELWTQRDQFTHKQIPLHDRDIIQNQHQHQLASHKFSAQAKTSKGSPDTTIKVGDLVYLVTDRNRTQARSRYIVTSREGL